MGAVWKREMRARITTAQATPRRDSSRHDYSVALNRRRMLRTNTEKSLVSLTAATRSSHLTRGKHSVTASRHGKNIHTHQCALSSLQGTTTGRLAVVDERGIGASDYTRRHFKALRASFIATLYNQTLLKRLHVHDTALGTAVSCGSGNEERRRDCKPLRALDRTSVHIVAADVHGKGERPCRFPGIDLCKGELQELLAAGSGHAVEGKAQQAELLHHHVHLPKRARDLLLRRHVRLQALGMHLCGLNGGLLQGSDVVAQLLCLTLPGRHNKSHRRDPSCSHSPQPGASYSGGGPRAHVVWESYWLYT